MVELHGLLHFVIRRLRDHSSTLELGILRSLLVRMGGYDLTEGVSTLSDHQLRGRAGSALLRRETASFGVVDRSSRRAADRLREVLRERDVGLPLLVLVAQVRRKVLYQMESRAQHIKLMGNLYDTCQTILDVLVDFINMDLSSPKDTSNLLSQTTESYDAILPSLGDLVQVYGLDVEVAWMMVRPVVRAALKCHLQTHIEQQQENLEAKVDEGTASVPTVPPKLTRWDPHSPTMKSHCTSIILSKHGTSLSYELFTTFWSHTLYDIYFPRDLYETEIARLRKDADRWTAQAKRDRNTLSTVNKGIPTGVEMLLDQAERARATTTALDADRAKQQVHCRAMRSALEQTKDALVLEVERQEGPMEVFLAQCILPRCTLTPQDALYCAKFVMLLHNTAVPNFSILRFVDCLLTKISGIMFGVTEEEAANLGVLLSEIWSVVSGWRYDTKKFDANIMTKPQSYEKFGKGNGMTPEHFKTFYESWHDTLLGSTLISCLTSTEYIHIRAALIVLNTIVQVYPTKSDTGEKLFDSLKPLQGDSRQDLKMMANASVAQLNKARTLGVWKEEDDSSAKKRSREEQAAMEEKIRNAKMKEEAMAKETARIGGLLRDGPGQGSMRRFGGGGGSSGGALRDRTPIVPFNPNAAVFVPPNGGPARDLRNSRGDSATMPPPTIRERSPHHDSYDRGGGQSGGGTGGSSIAQNSNNDSWSRGGGGNTESRDRRGDGRTGSSRDHHSAGNSRASSPSSPRAGGGGDGRNASLQSSSVSDGGRWPRGGSNRGGSASSSRGSGASPPPLSSSMGTAKRSMPELSTTDSNTRESGRSSVIERDSTSKRLRSDGSSSYHSTVRHSSSSSQQAQPPQSGGSSGRSLRDGGRDHDRDRDTDREQYRDRDRNRYRGARRS
eukprot:CAMPEP_0113329820 /NCGR_PEP_ID=MMETSP0010_2-20120614/21178_1 /TAXON_ID=216773 ORGANISM="Corethron hystrix, Strain 308" /NCGR_SAMPLE_ID=MMETSP0010_2 /ASSEMBLY_ACC=CAM_ASM_000155 /LENGTH=897 /DNA_ID=CAMNT_0000192083 /DNA_START=2040 /DNA_END=4733 /DNA_ORIENTATION=+ /assembly_acc=CAM_ASM_000155